MRLRPVVAAVIALQLALPGAMLVSRWQAEGSRPTTERPASWQMYSVVESPRYVGVAADGSQRELRTASLPPVVRAVGTGRTVPDRLCALEPELVSVRRVGGVQPGTYAC